MVLAPEGPIWSPVEESLRQNDHTQSLSMPLYSRRRFLNWPPVLINCAWPQIPPRKDLSPLQGIYLSGIIIVVVVVVSVHIIVSPMSWRSALVLHDGYMFSACSGSIGVHNPQPRLFN